MNKQSELKKVIRKLSDTEITKQILINQGWRLQHVKRLPSGDDLYRVLTPTGAIYKSETVLPEEMWEYAAKHEYPYTSNLGLAFTLFDGQSRMGGVFGAVSKEELEKLPLRRPITPEKYQATCYSLTQQGLSVFTTHDNPARAICEAVLELIWLEGAQKYPSAKSGENILFKLTGA